MIITFDADRAEYLAALDSGLPFETDEETFFYFLEVLPPIYMARPIVLPNGEKIVTDFGFAEGHEKITAFWKRGTQYFACRTNEINRV